MQPSGNVTGYQVIVASVLQKEGRFLCIEDTVNGKLILNQPAGRLEIGEPPAHGAVRQTLAESGYSFLPTYLVGIYEYYDFASATIFLHLAYTGALFAPRGAPLQPRDRAIHAVRWVTFEELVHMREQHRSPFVLQCVADYRAGKAYPLDAVTHFPPFPSF
jgi:ADP-ribose pyrophosphatase YjhB (NUDIX family)